MCCMLAKLKVYSCLVEGQFIQLVSLGWLRWLIDVVYNALRHIRVEFVYQVIVDIHVLKGCTMATMSARMT